LSGPTISVITIVLNRASDIEYTIQSIAGQTYADMEWIVIDGVSSDGTLDILQKYRAHIHLLVSEKDNGIYDAMNKGLKLAKGEYVLFINGGDALHSPDVIERIVRQYIDTSAGVLPDILYGECMFVDRERKPLGIRSRLRSNPLPPALNHDSFRLGSNVSHQSFLVKRTICPLYNTQFKLSSDIDWMLNCIRSARNIINTGLIISDFVLGDASEKQKIRSLAERFFIMSKHYGVMNTILSHFKIVLRSINSNKLHKTSG